MFLDPTFVMDFPVSKTIPTPTPLPTVIPDIPRVHLETLGHSGRTTLWVITVIMGLSSLLFYALAARVPVQKRLFHVLTSIATTVAFISYFGMASGGGYTFQHSVERTIDGIITDVYHRQVYWARYVDWAITTPLLLVSLSVLAGLNGASILIAIFANTVMVLSGLFSALSVNKDTTWGWYTIAWIAYLVVLYQVVRQGAELVAKRDNNTKAFFSLIAAFTFILWTVYPIIWGIAEGAWVLHVGDEAIAYAVLDVLAKPIFGIWLLTTHDRMTRTSPTIEGFWAHGVPAEGALRVGEDD
ncbi:bacteriorhodopsin [Xylariales sp. PMI_506]|nr:bacteriorhodopsin [Xylariales sp. PMI_506]